MRVISVLTIAVGAVVLGGCAGQRVVTQKSMEDQAKLEILRAARDPSAIEFAGPFVSGHRINFTLLCGYVNGTNMFGGHEGWTLVGVIFPDHGGPPSILPNSLPPAIQCPLANASPPLPGVSDELKRKHGISSQEPKNEHQASGGKRGKQNSASSR
jgi:hypothetical protein